MSNSLVQNVGYVGIDQEPGTVTVSKSIFRYNASAILVTADGVDLSGGALGGRNTIVCNSRSEAQPGGLGPGIGVQNTSTVSLNASNVDWDTPGPDVFNCSEACTCTIPSTAPSPRARMGWTPSSGPPEPS